MPKIHITIDPVANVKIEGVGFSGNDCTKATEGLEKVIAGEGAEVEREFKPEYRATGATAQTQQTTRMG